VNIDKRDTAVIFTCRRVGWLSACNGSEFNPAQLCIRAAADAPAALAASFTGRVLSASAAF
jgi:hypothetical protein